MNPYDELRDKTTAHAQACWDAGNLTYTLASSNPKSFTREWAAVEIEAAASVGWELVSANAVVYDQPGLNRLAVWAFFRRPPGAER